MSQPERRARLRVTIDGVPLVIQPAESDAAEFDPPRRGEIVTRTPPSIADRTQGIARYEVMVDGWLFEARAEPAMRAELRERVARDAAHHQVTSKATLRAQIPGRIARVWVAVGDAVDVGQRLLAIEAMKMENEIRAPQPGVIESINVEAGARVERGDELLTVGEARAAK